MASGLFGFVYNTLRKRVNDAKNQKYWLPQRLEELNNSDNSGKLLPIKEPYWDLGILQDEGGITIRNSLTASWWGLVTNIIQRTKPPLNIETNNYTPINCPNNPWPQLSMSGVIIDGLQNVLILPSPTTEQIALGYKTVIPLQVGYYNGQNGVPALPQLQVTGKYSLRQCVCAATKEDTSKCTDLQLSLKLVSWPEEEITGTGSIAVNFTNVYIDATVIIQSVGSDQQRTLQVVVENLQVRGSQPGTVPTLKLLEDKLTIDSELNPIILNTFKAQVINAFNHPATSQAIIANLNANLNQPGNRQQLEDMLTQQFNKLIDDSVGAVPPGQLPSDVGQQSPNAVNQYLFDRARFALNNPNSDYYLPKGIFSNTNPPLEPYQIDRISLGDQESAELGLQLQNLQLTQLQITGLSNTTVPADKLIFKSEAADAALALSTLNPAPQVTFKQNGSLVTRQIINPPLTITGYFSMQVAGDDDQLRGDVTITVNRSNVIVALTTEGQELSELQVNFKKLQIDAALSDIKIELNIDSAFKDVVNEILNQDEIKRQALQGINEKAAENLDTISQEATSNVKRLISSQLDG